MNGKNDMLFRNVGVHFFIGTCFLSILIRSMCDETIEISSKSWIRAAESINKVGYMDGAANGQRDVYQLSFDIGYKQGFSFGIGLGVQLALLGLQNGQEYQLEDPRKINCQICLDPSKQQETITNLNNNQREKNTLLFDIKK